jgi:hypothetical protein
MDRLRTCIDALRVLAISNAPDRAVLIERCIIAYLKTDNVSLGRGFERLHKAIHYEEAVRREGEDWSAAKKHVRSLLRGMA